MGRDNFVAPTAPTTSKRLPTPDVLGAVLNDTGKAVEVEAAKINTTGGTQMRAGLDDPTVFEYGQAMIAANGWATFPPVIAYHDGKNYWLADGFHRVAAFLESFPDPKKRIPVEVRAGTRRDAVLHAAGANAQHGLRRTNADKRRAVETLLRDEEWSKWSDRDIAKACIVSHTMVAQMRLSVTGNSASERTYTTKHGTQATMQTANIGTSRSVERRIAVQTSQPTPDSSARPASLDDLPVIDSVTVPVRTQAEIDAAIDEEIALDAQHLRNGIEARRDEDEQITHPLDCYEDPDEETDAAILARLEWPMKMRDLHELEMWLRQTKNDKAREYAKLTGCEAPAALGAAIDQMLEAIETAMDTVEVEATRGGDA